MTEPSETLLQRSLRTGEPHISALPREQIYIDYEGYTWLSLPSAFPDGSRALLCQRCGALVAAAEVHTRWHDIIENGIRKTMGDQ